MSPEKSKRRQAGKVRKGQALLGRCNKVEFVLETAGVEGRVQWEICKPGGCRR
jgi:hypothetical protein